MRSSAGAMKTEERENKVEALHICLAHEKTPKVRFALNEICGSSNKTGCHLGSKPFSSLSADHTQPNKGIVNSFGESVA